MDHASRHTGYYRRCAAHLERSTEWDREGPSCAVVRIAASTKQWCMDSAARRRQMPDSEQLVSPALHERLRLITSSVIEQENLAFGMSAVDSEKLQVAIIAKDVL